MFRSLNIVSFKRRPAAMRMLPDGLYVRGVTRVCFRCGCRCETARGWIVSMRLCGKRFCPTTAWADREAADPRVVATASGRVVAV